MKKIVVKVERTRTGFSAYTEKYPAFTTGKNAGELISNMVDSINTFLEGENSKKRIKATDLSFELQISSVFQVFPINVKVLSERIGMNYSLLSQYATGKKVPSQKQIDKIVNGIHQIGRELMEISLV